MDSLTQLALGAAVGHATLGRAVGRRALVWGALLGTLPDLDVLIPMGDPVSDYTWHRSWSHSLLVLTVAAPLFAWLAQRIHPATREHRLGWHALVLLTFWTHVVLDAFTVYGTQLAWPLPRAPESWSTVFVIDPAYTVPLLVGIAGAWLWQTRRPGRALAVNRWGLGLSSLYLAWSVVAKLHVEGVIADQLARDGVHDARVLTTPTPFNTLLWRVVVMRDGGYSEGFYSIVADRGEVDLRDHPTDDRLLDGLRDHAPVARLAWFSHGFCSVSRGGSDGNDVVITDLRMGSEPDYVFRFAVGRIDDGGVQPITPRKLTSKLRFEMLPRVWQRIWDSRASVSGR